MSEPLQFGAPTRGPHLEPVRPQPGPTVSLSASERSHRRRLVLDAQHAASIDDDVARLIARRKAAVALDEQVHVDTLPTRAASQIERFIHARERAADRSADAAAPAARPAPVVPGSVEPPLSTLSRPLLPQDAPRTDPVDAIAELARRRKTEVSTSQAAPVDASDVSRLLNRRLSAPSPPDSFTAPPDASAVSRLLSRRSSEV